MGVLNSNNKNCSQASLFGIYQLTMRFFPFIRFKIVVTEENTYFLASPPPSFQPSNYMLWIESAYVPIPPALPPSPVCELQALKLKPSFFNKKKVDKRSGGRDGRGTVAPQKPEKCSKNQIKARYQK